MASTLKAPKAAIRGGAQGFRTFEPDSVSKRKKEKRKRKRKKERKKEMKKRNENMKMKKSTWKKYENELFWLLPLAYAATRQQNCAIGFDTSDAKRMQNTQGK